MKRDRQARMVTEEYAQGANRQMLGRCQMTGKTQYSGKGRARKAMQGLSQRLRVYHCRDCGFWHLTKDAE